MKRISRRILLAAVLASAAYAGAEAQAPPTPPLPVQSTAGRDSFTFYCASCHGAGGEGDGAVAATLRTRPADLTALARRAGGTFPRERVREVISGGSRQLPGAHGSSEMPVWGPIFRSLDRSEPRNVERLENIVAYLEKLQQPSTAPGGLGARLFRTHCASCHGTNARGTGVLADEFRRPIPDLTKYTARNGGVFPRERVYQIVDGRGIAAHGTREMPVWGDAFWRRPDTPTEEAVRARLDAIVGYLEGIQERATD